LFDEDDGRIEVVALLALDTQFVTDLPGRQQNALGVARFGVGEDRQNF